MSIAQTGPKTIERALATMRARYKQMSGSQRRLADFMLEKPYQIAFASAAKVGGDLGVSSATVVRFAEFIGLDGYADLQALAQKALHREISEVTEFKRKSSVLTGESILHKSLRADIESIERTGELVTEATFDKAVQLIAKAHVIHIAGFRSTYGLAHQFAFNLNLIGRRALVLAPGVGDLPEQLLQMRAGDVCIAISFKRYTAQIREVIEYAHEAGVRIIAITDSELSPIGELADISLPVAVKFPSFLESRAASLSVINSLMTGVALLLRRATSESLSRHEALWARYETYAEESAIRSTSSHMGAFEALESRNGTSAAGVRRNASKGGRRVRRRPGD
jgi:DNA-binding MurR/RpiR family transcriptional regulator